MLLACNTLFHRKHLCTVEPQTKHETDVFIEMQPKNMGSDFCCPASTVDVWLRSAERSFWHYAIVGILTNVAIVQSAFAQAAGNIRQRWRQSKYGIYIDEVSGDCVAAHRKYMSNLLYT